MVAMGGAEDEELERLRREKLEKMLREAGREGGGKLRERIVIPAEDGNGLNARLSEHFGRAPYFIIVELEDGNISNVQVVPNESEHFGGFGRPPDRILQFRPNAVITYGMGPRALSIFQEARIAVLKANADTVKDVVEAYRQDKLEELTEGCRHARHR
jgi:predicted Fe-Mo cluster-binding NifX family protein